MLKVRMRLLCSKFYLLFLPIILIKFFLATLHAGSSGVAKQSVNVNVASAAVKRVLYM